MVITSAVRSGLWSIASHCMRCPIGQRWLTSTLPLFLYFHAVLQDLHPFYATSFPTSIKSVRNPNQIQTINNQKDKLRMATVVWHYTIRITVTFLLKCVNKWCAYSRENRILRPVPICSLSDTNLAKTEWSYHWNGLPTTVHRTDIKQGVFKSSSAPSLRSPNYYYYYRVLRAICCQPVDGSLICFM